MMPTVGWSIRKHTKNYQRRDIESKMKYQLKFGGVAQLGEHLPCKQGVRSSILLISTNSNNFTHISHFFSVLRTDVRDDVEEKANCTQTCLNLKSILKDCTLKTKQCNKR